MISEGRVTGGAEVLDSRIRVVLALLWALPSAAGAADGVREINQACALAGCFAGDPAGFPVVISEPGSYRLTSNLDVTVDPNPPDATAIQIATNEVAVDLAGFAITGATACNFLGSCVNTGNGSGISPVGGVRERISVHDGVIRGMGRYGIACDIGCSVERVAVQGNGSLGILIFNPPARVHANIVRNNGQGGVDAAGSITDNVIENNGGLGLRERGFSVVAQNRIYGNANGGSTCSYSTLVDNFLGFNSSFELRIDTGSRCALGRNTIVNTLDNSVGGFVEVDGNMCGGDLVCP
jgi:hypothetical protein